MKKIVCIIVLQALVISHYAGENKKMQNMEFGGYLSGMPSLSWNSDSSQYQVLLHNRINLHWYPSSSWTVSVQMRNQVMAGDRVEYMDIEDGFKKDNYALPLSFHQKFGDTYRASMAIDRAWLQYTHKNLDIKLGRQRITWGQTFVWNPNDIFNSYNFFDFDYPERPGADAIRIQYYPNYNSELDLAAKTDSAGNIIGGGLYRFTKWNTEFQIIGGYFSKSNRLIQRDGTELVWKDKDLVTGMGFSAGIKSVSLRGEISYLHSLKEDVDSTNQFMGSLTVDYTFANSLGMMFEFFYVNRVNLSVLSFLGTTGGSQDIKSLAFTKYNLFGQASYPIMPILNGTVSGMCFYDEDLFGFYTGPSFDLSLGDNLGLSAIFQIFAFRYENPFTQEDEWANANFVYLRLKWNF